MSQSNGHPPKADQGGGYAPRRGGSALEKRICGGFLKCPKNASGSLLAIDPSGSCRSERAPLCLNRPDVGLRGSSLGHRGPSRSEWSLGPRGLLGPRESSRSRSLSEMTSKSERALHRPEIALSTLYMPLQTV